VEIRFSELRHDADVARALGTTIDALARYAKAADQSGFYTTIRLPKQSRKRPGEYRTVYKAEQPLALLHKNIASAIAAATTFEDHVQGFVSKRSIVTNARVHLGQKLLLHADIHHFFESITIDQVHAALRSLGCNAEVARLLAGVCTRNARLPEGSNSSPILANLVGRFLDADLKNLARAHGCHYTRYADDITFSGDEVPDCAQVAAILQQYGFALRDGRCRTQRRGRAQYVTGLTISDPRGPHIPRRMKRRLRLELYYATRYGLRGHLARTNSRRSPAQELNRLGGWISFMSSVEGRQATQRFHETWSRLDSRETRVENGDSKPGEQSE